MRACCRYLLLGLGMLPGLAIAAPSLYLETDPSTPVAQIRLPERSAGEEGVTLSADEVGMDREHGVVVARGKVEVLQGDSILMADQITYYQNSDLVVAEGNISMLQPTGDVYFADRAELKDGMKRGVIQDFKARFADNSVLGANRAIKASPSVTALKEASYTSCKVCKGKDPFWQMNAADAVVDANTERVTYHNAFMEMFGFPMFYTPYLSHPTPDARAKSGLLAPTYNTNIYFGAVLKAPVYWRIAEDKDVVLTPWFTSSVGPVLQWDYKQLRNAGNYHVQGSITNPPKLDDNGNEISGNELRGHIFAQGEEELGDHKRLGFNIQRTTDDTYLRRYSFGGQQSLFSSAYYEYANRRNLGLMSAVSIQGLRSVDDAKTTPQILPIFQGYYETPSNDYGMKFHVAGDAQSLTREIGVSQRRISISPGMTWPMTTEGGHVFTTSLNVRQDMYDSDNVQLSNGSIYDGTTTRTIPQAALEWRYPLISSIEGGTWLMEPIALAVWQPNGGNTDKISNEDSNLIELSDTNLFSLDRMPGLDLVDSGARFAYGVRSQYYAPGGTTLEGMLGQNYNFNSDTPFPNSIREGQQFSDYIGRVAVQIDPVAIAYRFAVDSKEYEMNRNEVSLGFSKPWLALGIGYRDITNNRYLKDSREGVINTTVPLDDNWSTYGSAVRDLELSQMVSANGGLVYNNECFSIMFDTLRTYARDRDITPTTQFSFRVGFRNLGEFGGK